MDRTRLLALMADLEKLRKLHKLAYLQGEFSFRFPQGILQRTDFVLLDGAFILERGAGEELRLSKSELVKS